MDFLEKLDFLIKKDWEDKKKFAEKCEIPYRTIINWKNSGYKNMSITTFKKLCGFLGVTMDSMAYDDKEIEYVSDIGKHNKLSSAEKELLTNFGELDEIGKGRLLERSQTLIEDGKINDKQHRSANIS